MGFSWRQNLGRSQTRRMRDNPSDRAAHQTEQGQSGKHVDREVERVIAPGCDSAHGVVECESEVEKGSSLDGEAVTVRWRERLPERPQVAERRIVDDGRLVVEEQGNAEAAGVRGQHYS